MDAVALDRKLAGLRAILARRGAAALVLAKTANFAWLTAGGDNRVRNAADLGACFLVITPERRLLLANAVEAPRVLAEEVAGQGWEPCCYAWHASPQAELQNLLGGQAVILSDCGLWGTANVEAEIAPLRFRLDVDEQRHLRQAGILAAEALASAARRLAPGQSEHQAAALICREVIERGALPAVCLVGADERLRRYRHPIPSDNVIGRSVLLVLGARWRGLIACCSRVVHFGPLDADLRRRHEAVCRVDGTLILGTRPGRVVGDLLAAAIETYTEAGFGDEWQLHHQGGATGFETREYLAMPGDRRTVLEDQAFAWNPTITGTKSEDTILAGAGGAEIVTTEGSWPTIAVDTRFGRIQRPNILVR